MVLPDDAKRLAVFAYYDADGEVDDYVPFLLRAVGRFCEKQIVVVNGALTPAAEKKLRAVCGNLLFRPNEGYDITAYKEGVLSEQAHWDAYDELLFYNQTIFGPVCPLDAMFREMNARDVDFWGLTRHKGAPAASWDDTVVIPPHVQSFFFAVRGRMLHSDDFAQYWQSLPPIRNYWEAVGKHEIVFTARFASLGYRWDTYIDTAALERFNDYPLMGMPAALLRDHGCPFFKRKSFLMPRESYTTVPQGEAAQALYEYLRDETDYPLSFVAQNLMRTAETAAVTRALTPCFDVNAPRPAPAGRCAAVLYIDRDALAPPLLEQAARLSADADCFVLFADASLAARFEHAAGAARVFVTDGVPGMRFLFENLWDDVRRCAYILFLSTAMPLVLGEFEDATSLAIALESLAQPGCAAIFDENPVFGALLPLPPIHQDTLTMGARLPRDWECVETALASGGMRAVRAGTQGLASRGGVFLARTEAVEGLSRLDWSVLDEADWFGGAYPLCETLIPLAAQAAGFLTGWAADAHRAFVALGNRSALMTDVLRLWSTPNKTRYDQIVFRMRGIMDFYQERRFQMTLEQAFAADLTVKQKLWICLRILLSPKAFERLRRLLGRGGTPAAQPHDDLD